MNRIPVSAAWKTLLTTAVHRAVIDLFTLMERDDKLFASVRDGMYTLDVLVIVSYVRWSKWPFHRQAVRLEPATLRDPQESARVAQIVAGNLSDLLARDLNEASLEVLCTKLDAATLGGCIERLYMNKFTANELMVQMLSDAIACDLDRAFDAAVAGHFAPLSGAR